MRHKSCPICRGADLAVSLQEPHEVLRCGTCGAMFLAAFPEAGTVRGYYQSEYYEAGSGQRFLGIFEWIVRFFRSRRARAVQRALARCGWKRAAGRTPAILDVGCGRGVLLDCFRRQAWRVEGTQLSETAARACRERYRIAAHVGELTELGLRSGDYDVVTLYHVLEHVTDPSSYLMECRRLVRDGGLLVVEVPDSSSPSFRKLGARDLCFDYPHHLFFFTPASLRGLLEQSGFEVARVDRFSLEYSPFTTLQNMLNRIFKGRANRLYRSLARNRDAKILRRHPRTWLHWAVAGLLAGPALVVSLASLLAPVGNTVRFTCVPSGSAARAAEKKVAADVAC